MCKALLLETHLGIYSYTGENGWKIEKEILVYKSTFPIFSLCSLTGVMNPALNVVMTTVETC